MKILCLANSFKESGRCLAGIQLNAYYQPVMNGKRPVWIRPICNTQHGQIPTYLCDHISILDVVEIGNVKMVGSSYQSENVNFDESSLEIVRSMDKNILRDNLFDNNSMKAVFGNSGKAVAQKNIDKINHSLMFVKTSYYQAYQKKYDDREHSQIRLQFQYNNNIYDLPVTDPKFLTLYGENSKILDNADEIFLVLSLGVPFQGWYYKLVATVIY